MKGNAITTKDIIFYLIFTIVITTALIFTKKSNKFYNVKIEQHKQPKEFEYFLTDPSFLEDTTTKTKIDSIISKKDTIIFYFTGYTKEVENN